MKKSPSGNQSPDLSGRIQIARLDDLIPYWRNPRRITDEAVNAVAASIREYGYQQPIVVDEKMVIIMGHTRYAALRRMKVEEIPVLIEKSLSPEKIKQLRIVDNRTSEYAFWDFDKLIVELESADSELMKSFFPDVLGLNTAVFEEVELDEHLGESSDRTAAAVAARELPDAEFVCPSCFHIWETQITREQLLSGKVETE